MGKYVDVVNCKTTENHDIYTVQIGSAETEAYIDVECTLSDNIKPVNEWSKDDWDNWRELVGGWQYNVEIRCNEDDEIVVTNEKNDLISYPIDTEYIAEIIEKVSLYRLQADLELMERVYMSGLQKSIVEKPSNVLVDGECLYVAVYEGDNQFSTVVVPRYGSSEMALLKVDEDGKDYKVMKDHDTESKQGLSPLFVETKYNVDYVLFTLFDDIEEAKMQEEYDETNH